MSSQSSDAAEAVTARLDKVATALIASVTATSALLALLGVNGERMWVLLDDNSAKKTLSHAGFLMLAAIVLGFAGYLIPSKWIEVGVLALGASCFIISLGLILSAATDAADVGGRPSIVDLEVTREAGTLSVIYQVEGASVDDDERLGVQLVDVPSGTVLTESYPRATAGHIDMKVAVPIAQDSSGLRLQVWRIEPGDSSVPDCYGPPSYEGGSDCVWVNW
ncbi:MAG TPA: hypothetical protein VEX15_22965 [Nocardioidaceae bacterium]|nr:hypothetical protein [Nocardioidaceae bacterium]